MIKNTSNLKETNNLNPALVEAIMTAGQSARTDGGLANLNRALMNNTYPLNDYYVKREAHNDDSRITETEELGIIHLVTAAYSNDVFYFVLQISGISLDLSYVYTRERKDDYSESFSLSPRATEKTKMVHSLSPAEYAISLGKYDRAAALFAYGSSINVEHVMHIVRSDVTVKQALDYVKAQLPDNEVIRSTFDWQIRNSSPHSSPPTISIRAATPT
jgi:hypothetical protein